MTGVLINRPDFVPPPPNPIPVAITFVPASPTIAEDATVGTIVSQANCSTSDSSPFTGVWALTDSDGGKFAIDSSTGQITVAASLVGTGGTIQNITVSATENGTTIFNGLAINVTAAAGTAPTIANQTFAIDDGFINGQVVGTVNLTNSPSPAPTWSITAGDPTGAFTINSSSGVITVLDHTQLNHVTTPSYSLTVHVTNTAGSDNKTMTVNVAAAAADNFIGNITVTDISGVDKTNAIVSLGVPLSNTALPPPREFRLYDDDGAGGKGAVLGFQVDGICSEAGDGAVPRYLKLTAIIPNIGPTSLVTRKLGMYASTSSVPTGTAITAADILATSFRVLVTATFAGVDYTVDSNNLLAASSTFSKTAAWKSANNWRLGPFCSEFHCSSPVMNAGTPLNSGNSLHIDMDITAYKAQAAAVSVGNPITAVRFVVTLRNGDVERSAADAQSLYYGLKVQRATSLTDGTLITTNYTNPDGMVEGYQWDTKSPASDITFSTSGTGFKTVTLASGSWDSNIIGAHITADSGTGKAFITVRLNATQVTAYVYEAFSSTTITSGTWTQNGIAHGYNSSASIVGWVGDAPTNVAAWGAHTSAATPTTRNALDYLTASRMMLNLSVPFSAVTNNPTKVNLMLAPDGTQRPFMQTGPQSVSTYTMGNMTTDVGATGGRGDIGPVPLWTTASLAKGDQTGRFIDHWNARIMMTYPFVSPQRYSGTPTNGQLPVALRADNGTTYAWDSRFGGTLLQRPSAYVISSLASFPNWYGDTAHIPEPVYAQFLRSGDYHWMQWMDAQAIYLNWLSLNNAYNGSGINKTVFGDATGVTATVGGNDQTRSRAWSARTLFFTAAMTPDDSKPDLYNDKSYYLTWIFNHFHAMKLYLVDDIKGVYGTGHMVYYYPNTGKASGQVVQITITNNPGGGTPGTWTDMTFSAGGAHTNGFYTIDGTGTIVAAGLYEASSGAGTSNNITFPHAGAGTTGNANAWNGTLIAPWQKGYYAYMMAMPQELGLVNSDYTADFARHFTYFSGFAFSSGVADYVVTPTYEVVIADNFTFTAHPNTWDEIYQRSALMCSIGGFAGAISRPATGLTISLDSYQCGSGRTMTFSANKFSGGGSWYVGGWICEHSNKSLNVTGAVDDGTGQVRLTVASGATSWDNGHNSTRLYVTGVGGVPGANGVFPCQVVDNTHVILLGSVFSGAYTTGGSARCGGGFGQIEAVDATGTILTVKITCEFTSTNPLVASMKIPAPHPSDYDGSFDTISNISYARYHANAGRFMTDHGDATGVNVTSNQTTRPGWSEYDANMTDIQFYVLPR